MYNNNKGNNKDRKEVTVNTKGIQFKNKNGIDPSTVVIDYWKDSITVKIHPALPVEKQTAESVYDYEHFLNTVLVVPKIQTLVSAIPKFREAMEAEKAYSTGVKVGTNSIFMISTGVKETGSVRPFVAIYKDIDAETLQAGQGIRYEFNQQMTFEDYDPEGCQEVGTMYNAELEVFFSILENAIPALTNIYTHSIRNVENFFKLRLTEIVTNTANKVGAEVPTTGRKPVASGGEMFKISQSQAGQSSGYQALADAPMTEGGLDDDLPF